MVPSRARSSDTALSEFWLVSGALYREPTRPGLFTALALPAKGPQGGLQEPTDEPHLFPAIGTASPSSRAWVPSPKARLPIHLMTPG